MLTVEGLSASFPAVSGTFEAISDISFSIERGEIVGLVGESGCGKSVTAFSIVGLTPSPGVVTSGAVLLNGISLLQQTPRQWEQVRGRQIGVVFQDSMAALNPVLPVGAQIADAIKAHMPVTSREARNQAIEMLDRVGIPDPAKRSKSFPHEFSGGMRQRVMIAQALSCKPDLLIADEPTTALDVTIQAEILDLIQSLRDDLGMGVLFITHNLGVIARIADSVNVMYGGRIIEAGTVDDIFGKKGHPYTEGLIRATPRIDVPTLPHPIPGRVPGLTERITGCRFRPRCAYAFEPCFEQPRLEPVGEAGSRLNLQPLSGREHVAACWALRPDGSLRPQTPDADAPAAVHAGSSERVDVAGEPLVTLDAVSVVYRGRKRRKADLQAVDEVSLTLRAGETLGIVGESGSGKSSLARALLGIVPSSSGLIAYGTDRLKDLLRRRDRSWRRRVQMIFQDPYASLDPSMSVGHIIAEGVRVHGLVPRAQVPARVVELLEAVGLDASVAKRYPRQFSGGQRQRIAIARSLAVEPEVIVCDEAVSSLDVSVQAQILELLRNLQNERGLAYIFISHDLGVVRQIADRVVVMYGGRIVEASDNEGMFDRPLHPYTAALLSAVPVPDPQVERERRQLVKVTGAESRPIVAEAGCPYRFRCPRAEDLCAAVDPLLSMVEPGRSAACHFPLIDGRPEQKLQVSRA